MTASLVMVCAPVVYSSASQMQIKLEKKQKIKLEKTEVPVKMGPYNGDLVETVAPYNNLHPTCKRRQSVKIVKITARTVPKWQ